MSKQKIIKIALGELLRNGVESFSIQNLSINTSLDAFKINELFTYGDRELLMDAVTLAGKVWVKEIRNDIDKEDTARKKLRMAARGFTLGTEDYPESLSVYIDLWKIVKDEKDGYIQERLKELYRYYASEFVDIVSGIGNFARDEEEVKAFSLIVTVLSDVLHIQSITLRDDVDFEVIGKVIEEMTLRFFRLC
jgi:undecaprenyl pyrophosphate synthase